MSGEPYWPDLRTLPAIGTRAWTDWEPFVRALALARYPETLLALLEGEDVPLDELEPYAVKRLGAPRRGRRR